MIETLLDRAITLLSDLIALPTVNPMGGPYDGGAPVERPVIEYLERLFEPYGLAMRRQQVNQIHENLILEVPGQIPGTATLFESHMDTVPADDWLDHAFEPRVSGTMIYGRGSCDDKGSLAAMVLALIEVLESGIRPPLPIVLLAAADEEYSQSGIRYFLKEWDGLIGRGVFGEPTQCVPVIQHKGTIRWDITVHGRSAHSSCPEMGRNAIIDMLKVVRKLAQIQEALRRQHTNPLVTGPTLTVTRIQGGRTRNAVPDNCTIAVDLRILPGMDPKQTSRDVIKDVNGLDIQVSHADFQCCAPPLNTSVTDSFTKAIVAICSDQLGRSVHPAGEPYGSDASWMPDDIPTVLLGPGDIRTAHAVDETVDMKQVLDCAAIHHRIMTRTWEQDPR